MLKTSMVWKSSVSKLKATISRYPKESKHHAIIYEFTSLWEQEIYRSARIAKNVIKCAIYKKKNNLYAIIWVQRRPWSACANAQADLGLRCLLTESMDTVVCVNRECSDQTARMRMLSCPQIKGPFRALCVQIKVLYWTQTHSIKKQSIRIGGREGPNLTACVQSDQGLRCPSIPSCRCLLMYYN